MENCNGIMATVVSTFFFFFKSYAKINTITPTNIKQVKQQQNQLKTKTIAITAVYSVCICTVPQFHMKWLCEAMKTAPIFFFVDLVGICLFCNSVSICFYMHTLHCNGASR